MKLLNVVFGIQLDSWLNEKHPVLIVQMCGKHPHCSSYNLFQNTFYYFVLVSYMYGSRKMHTHWNVNVNTCIKEWMSWYVYDIWIIHAKTKLDTYSWIHTHFTIPFNLLEGQSWHPKKLWWGRALFNAMGFNEGLVHHERYGRPDTSNLMNMQGILLSKNAIN